MAMKLSGQPGKVLLSSAKLLDRYILSQGGSDLIRIENRDAGNSIKVAMSFSFVEVDL